MENELEYKFILSIDCVYLEIWVEFILYIYKDWFRFRLMDIVVI